MAIKPESFVALLISASLKAGKAILEVYQSDFGVELKSDQSPLTLADKKAHHIICRELKKTDLPVLSEEGRKIPFDERRNWTSFWMIDPLDGTKEFVKRNGEFSVNIALVENQKPIVGIIYAPVLDVLYIGSAKTGAQKIENASIKLSKESEINAWEMCATRLPLAIHTKSFRIVASRSHQSKETEEFMAVKRKEFKNIEIVSKGSSLKLCMIAEGLADVYPRFAPTMEWDTAAGHAIINAAGGKVVQVGNNSKELFYNKADLLNPWFVAHINKE